MIFTLILNSLHWRIFSASKLLDFVHIWDIIGHFHAICISSSVVSWFVLWSSIKVLAYFFLSQDKIILDNLLFVLVIRLLFMFLYVMMVYTPKTISYGPSCALDCFICFNTSIWSLLCEPCYILMLNNYFCQFLWILCVQVTGETRHPMNISASERLIFTSPIELSFLWIAICFK